MDRAVSARAVAVVLCNGVARTVIEPVGCEPAALLGDVIQIMIDVEFRREP